MGKTKDILDRNRSYIFEYAYTNGRMRIIGHRDYGNGSRLANEFSFGGFHSVMPVLLRFRFRDSSGNEYEPIWRVYHSLPSDYTEPWFNMHTLWNEYNLMLAKQRQAM